MDTKNTFSAPAFGGRLRTPEFYAQTNSIIRTLRGKATLKVLAQHLNNQQFTTPTGREWTKDRLAAYLKSTAFKQ